ncbi:MAG TPA: plastocyanin/azurin family copper-binding protein [Chloroflexota bacterium]
MRFRQLLITLCAFAFAIFAALPATNSPAATGVNWQVSAGSGTPDAAVTGMAFYPPVITIDVGDSITWSANGDAHTVAFLSGAAAPPPISPAAGTPAGGTSYDGTGFVNSGIVTPGSTFTLNFTKAGTFQYQCLFHPVMHGTVVVQPAGTPYPLTQADYNEAATVAEQTDLGQGNTLRSQLQTTPPATTKNADGSTNYNVHVGASVGMASIMRFAPGKLTIAVGDTVTWTNTDMIDPHTVTFAPDGKYPDFPSPAAFTPAGGPTYDGTTFTNSGLIFPAPAPAIPGIPTTASFTLKFTKPGVYVYHCLIHDPIGMVGKIRVVAAGASTTLGPPVATVANNPALGPILVDSNGHTLYFLTSEIAGQPLQCTGNCLKFWFPLTVPTATTDAVEGPGVTGTFEVIARPDGINQVNYGEAPLYTFVGDKAPGDIHGQGIKAFGGVWLAAQTTPNTLIAPIVTAHGSSGSSASFVVSFTSTAPGQGSVLFGPGTSCSGLVEVATQDLGAGTTAHTIQVKGNEMPGTVGDNGIQAGTTYSFEVVTSSSTGVQTDNNGGKCYTVTIPSS